MAKYLFNARIRMNKTPKYKYQDSRFIPKIGDQGTLLQYDINRTISLIRFDSGHSMYICKSDFDIQPSSSYSNREMKIEKLVEYEGIGGA